MRGPDKRQIDEMLRDRIDDLVFDLFPGAQIEPGKRYIWPEPGADGSSFQVYLGRYGKKVRGDWRRYSQNTGGGPIELIMYAEHKVVSGKAIWQDALQIAARFLGLTEPETPRERAEREKRRAAARQREEMAQRARDLRAAADVRTMIAATGAVTEGDPVWRYLTEFRRLPLTVIPPALRLHPDLPHFAGAEHKGAPWRGPAMVARLAGATGCHVTLLKPDGLGKAPIGKKAKLMRGPVAGGFVALANPSGRTLAEVAAAGETEDVAVTEGIETGLGNAIAIPEIRVIAALSLGNIAALAGLLGRPGVGRVFWVRENDIKPAALEAQERARQALEATGKEIIEMPSPIGSDTADCY